MLDRSEFFNLEEGHFSSSRCCDFGPSILKNFKGKRINGDLIEYIKTLHRTTYYVRVRNEMSDMFTFNNDLNRDV